MDLRLRERLCDVARRGETITYQPLADMLDMNLDLQHERARLGKVLGEISRGEHAAGRPLLSAVVVLGSSRMPGRGFFDLARELGVHASRDDVAFYAAHLRAVHDCWRAPRKSGSGDGATRSNRTGVVG